MKEIKEEAVELLSRCIKFDTTNPPGNELPLCEFLKDVLKREGFDVFVEKTDENRGNIYAEIKGDSDPPVILLSHLDVVGADPKEWKYHPFSGEVRDGYVWGRGAIDCKGLMVMELMAMKLLKREGVKPKRSIIFCATSDEEMGGKKGAFIAAERLSGRLKGAFVINEGGLGIKKMFGEKDLYSPDFGEKGPLWIELSATGKAGHGSMPHDDNANLKIVKALNAIFSMRKKLKVIPELYDALKFLKEEKGFLRFLPFLFNLIPSFLLKRLLSKNYRLSALFYNTVSLTILNGGYKENVIPGSSRAVIDVRILPGESPDEFIEKIEKVLKRYGVQLKILSKEMPSLSNPFTSYMSKIKEVIKSQYPDSIFLPLLVPGFTDSRFMRMKGAIAYGFIPVLFEKDDIDRVHGVDERISQDALLEGTMNMVKIVKEIAGE